MHCSICLILLNVLRSQKLFHSSPKPYVVGSSIPLIFLYESSSLWDGHISYSEYWLLHKLVAFVFTLLALLIDNALYPGIPEMNLNLFILNGTSYIFFLNSTKNFRSTSCEIFYTDRVLFIKILTSMSKKIFFNNTAKYFQITAYKIRPRNEQLVLNSYQIRNIENDAVFSICSKIKFLHFFDFLSCKICE